MKRLAVLFTALTVMLALAPAALAEDDGFDGWGDRPDSVVDVVIESGGEFDRNKYDYDILLTAVIAADLVDLLDSTGNITVWAPNDKAFIKTARDLGYTGWGEEGAWNFLVEALDGLSGGDPIGLLTTILSYHVSPGRYGVFSVLFNRPDGGFPTLLGEGFEIGGRFFRLADADRDIRDPRVTFPLNIRTGNGSVVHTINRVLIPVDIP